MGYLLIALGAAAGALLRYQIDLWAMGWNPRPGIPWGTFIINMTGSLIIGILFGVIPSDSKAKLLLMVGFCGSYTTFSTYSLEIFRLWGSGQAQTATVYALLSLVVGPTLCFAGYWLTK
jgi:fluoride exporter